MEHIDVVYYINLDYREDRRKEIEEELDKWSIPLSKRVRIPGIRVPQLGILGCGLAHMKAIETFLESSYTTCIIFEDDFTFSLEKEHMDMMLNAVYSEEIPFDCIMLAGNLVKTEPTEHTSLRKVLQAQTSSGYILTRAFAPTLLKILEESSELLLNHYKETGEKKHDYCMDIYWKQLQSESNWYVFLPKFGFQRRGYSDIENKVTSYGV